MLLFSLEGEAVKTGERTGKYEEKQKGPGW